MSKTFEVKFFWSSILSSRGVIGSAITFIIDSLLKPVTHYIHPFSVKQSNFSSLKVRLKES